MLIMKELNRLVSVLDEEARCYDRIRHEQQAEQQNIISHNYSALDENVLQIERLCWHLENLEREREKAVRDLSMNMGWTSFPQELTVTDIAERVSPPQATKLREVSDRLSALLDQVGSANQENAYLLGRSLQSVSEILGSLLKELNETNLAYTNQGQAKAQPVGAGLFNQHA